MMLWPSHWDSHIFTTIFSNELCCTIIADVNDIIFIHIPVFVNIFTIVNSYAWTVVEW